MTLLESNFTKLPQRHRSPERELDLGNQSTYQNFRPTLTIRDLH